jgi:dUTP pyrophosphatase
MKVKIFNAVGDDVFIDKYDRVAQLVIIPYDTSQPEEVDELDHTERGHGGYGSTGKK